MTTHRHKIAGTHLNIEVHQFFGFPFIYYPIMADVLITELRRVPVCLDVVVVLGIALYVHAAGVPISLLGDALRTPMSPDPELGVAKPIGVPVSLQGFPIGPERPRDRAACDRDAAWPALTDQLRLRHAVTRAQSMAAATAAAALAVAQVLAVVDGSTSIVTLGAQLAVRGPDHLADVVPVTRHPVCGCGWGDTTRTIGA